MGGSIARLVADGHDVHLLDMTDGEPTPKGDPQTRALEAERAAKILGVTRECLQLPNRSVTHSLESRHAVTGVIRSFQAQVVFTPYYEDAHPDHVATTRIVEDARFDSKLTKIDLPGEPIYPRWLFYYYCQHLRQVPNPSFIIDTTGHATTKRESILAYRSQFVEHEPNRRIIELIDASGTYFGGKIRTESGEPFYSREPIGLSGLDGILSQP